MGGRILQNVIFISAFQKRVIKILCVTKYSFGILGSSTTLPYFLS